MRNDQPLRLEDVQQVLKVWHVMFPGNRSSEEMTVLSHTYFASLSKRMSQKVFFMAAERAQTGTSWFPKISEILIHRNDVVAEINRRKNGNLRMLTHEAEHRSEEETKMATDCIALIKQMFNPGVDKQAIVRQVEEITGMAQRN